MVFDRLTNIILVTVQNRLVTPDLFRNLRQRHDHPLSQILAPHGRIDTNILDMPDQTRIPQELPLDKQRRRRNDPPRADVFKDKDVVCRGAHEHRVESGLVDVGGEVGRDGEAGEDVEVARGVVVSVEWSSLLSGFPGGR